MWNQVSLLFLPFSHRVFWRFNEDVPRGNMRWPNFFIFSWFFSDFFFDISRFYYCLIWGGVLDLKLCIGIGDTGSDSAEIVPTTATVKITNPPLYRSHIWNAWKSKLWQCLEIEMTMIRNVCLEIMLSSSGTFCMSYYCNSYKGIKTRFCTYYTEEGQSSILRMMNSVWFPNLQGFNTSSTFITRTI